MCEAVGAVLRHVHAHMDCPGGAKDWAEIAGFSRYHFQRSFLRLTGEAPAALVRRLLLERAAYRIQTTPQSIAEVAADAGFASQAAFGRAFEQAFRVSPTHYRLAKIPLFWQAAPSGVHFSPEGDSRFEPLARPGVPPIGAVEMVAPEHVFGIAHPGLIGYGSTLDRLNQALAERGIDPRGKPLYIYTHEPKRPRQTWRVRGSVGYAGLPAELDIAGAEHAIIGDGLYLIKRYQGHAMHIADFWARAWHEDAPRLHVLPRHGNAFNRMLTFPTEAGGAYVDQDIYMPVRELI